MKFKKLSDEDLIKGIKSSANSGECLMELVYRHSGIFMSMVHSYTPNNIKVMGSSKTDILLDKDYYIYQAALKYDDSRNTKFSTYLGNETKWMCLNMYNRFKSKSMREIPLEPCILSPEEEEDISETGLEIEDIFNKIMDIVNEQKDQRVKDLFRMRYIDSTGNKVMPWRDVGIYLNLSIQGCINIHNKTINKIKRQLNKEL